MIVAHAVVVGAGPAGAAAALVLARAGRRVVLVDGVRRRAAVGEALPGGARPLVRELGLVDAVAAHPPCLGTLSVWGGTEPARREALRDPHGAGWHLDRATFDPAVRDRAHAAGVVGVRTARSARIARDADGWTVTTDDATIRAPFAVDATGRASAVARAAGVRRERTDRLVAFVARAAPGEPDPWTRVQATPDGWWYTAQTAASRIVAFHTDPDLADRPALLTPEGFARNRAHASWLDAALDGAVVDRPHGVDAGSARLGRAVGEGWLAVGDAAVSFDPLSSQGLLNGLYTGLRGGQAVAAALDGDGEALDAYADRVDAIYAAYLGHRAAFYGAEGRWADRPFWARRAAHAVAV